LYIVWGHPIPAGVVGTGDRGVKRSKDLSMIINYGTRGCGPDQLTCPFGITVDSEFAYIANFLCGELAKRNKSDLSYVDEISVGGVHAVHTNGVVLFAGYSLKVEERNLNDLSLIRTLTNGGNPDGAIGYAADLTADDMYLYVSDTTAPGVLIYDINSLTYVGRFGDASEMFLGAVGIWADGTDIFVYDSGGARDRTYKITEATWTKTAYSNLNYHWAIFGFGSKLYTVADALDSMEVRNLSDLSLDTTVSGEFSIPTDVWVDTSYIYVCNDFYIVKLDIATYALVDENGDRTGVVTTGNNGYNYNLSIVGDATHVFVLDSGNNRVIKRLKTNFNYVSEYADPGYVNLVFPQFLSIDATYIYVSDRSSSVIHRINKATMAYVDSFGAGELNIPYQIHVVGNFLYVADLGSAYSFVKIFNLTTLLVTDTSPATYGDSNFWLDDPNGIDADENNIYVATVNDDGKAYIKVFNRIDYSFVGEFEVAVNVQHLAVDDQYIYVTFFAAAGYVRKYDKVTYALVAESEEEYATGIDTLGVFQI
jgi:hypothetical protein